MSTFSLTFLPKHQAEAITTGSSGNRTAKAPENTGLIDWRDWIFGVYAYICNCNIQSSTISTTICFSCSPWKLPNTQARMMSAGQGQLSLAFYWVSGYSCWGQALLFLASTKRTAFDSTSMLSCLDLNDPKWPAQGLSVIASAVFCALLSRLFLDLVHFKQNCLGCFWLAVINHRTEKLKCTVWQISSYLNPVECIIIYTHVSAYHWYYNTWYVYVQITARSYPFMILGQKCMATQCDVNNKWPI